MKKENGNEMLIIQNPDQEEMLHPEQQEMLLLGKVIINAQNHDGKKEIPEENIILDIPQLHYAVANRNKEYVQQLLTENIDPNSTDDYLFTSLHLAVFLKNSEILQMILKHPKADPNLVDQNGYTALHLAVLEKDNNCAKILYQNGANPTIPNLTGKTPLNIAEETDPEIASTLKKNGQQFFMHRFFSLLKRKIKNFIFSRNDTQSIFRSIWAKLLTLFQHFPRQNSTLERKDTPAGTL